MKSIVGRFRSDELTLDDKKRIVLYAHEHKLSIETALVCLEIEDDKARGHCECESPSQKVITLFPFKEEENCSNCGKPVTMESISNAIRLGKLKEARKP